MSDAQAGIDQKAIFWIGVLALFTAGFSASIRAAIASSIKSLYFDPVDPAHSVTMVAAALGSAFLGFCLALVITSLFLDRIGMRRMTYVAAASYIVGPLLLIFAGTLGQQTHVYAIIWLGIFVNGLGWGATEGTINPMIGALFPRDTTHYMNRLHAWWPAGLVCGGLLGVIGPDVGMSWRALIGIVPLLGVAIALLCIGRRFPGTTAATLGIDRGQQFRELVARPSFWIWFGLMLFTAASELAPGQWVDISLSNVVGMRGVLLLAYVAALQFVGRHFAGPIEARFSTEGLLCLSCLFSAIGLFLLSFANTPASAIAASTLWGVGVCFIWPTMIAVVAARYPRGGALAVGLMGVSGSISTYFVLPILGAVYDRAKISVAGGEVAFGKLSGERLQEALVFAASQSFKAVALIPAALFLVFVLLWLLRRRRDGMAAAINL